MSVRSAQKLALRLSAFRLKGESLAVLRQNSEMLRTLLAPIAYGFYGLLEGWPELQPKFRSGVLYDTRMRHAYVLMSGVFEDDYVASVEALARACIEQEIGQVDLMLAHSLTGQELLQQLSFGRPQNQADIPSALPGILSRLVAFDLVNLVEMHQEITQGVAEPSDAPNSAA